MKLGPVYAEPFPHMVVHGFYPDEDRLHAVVRDWPTTGWGFKDARSSVKSSLAETAHMPLAAREVIADLNGPAFVKRLSESFGIELIADPSYERGYLHGGGLHDIGPAGFLKIHVDFNRHPEQQRLYRRLNLLLYLNEGWQSEWGGDLELQETNGRVAAKIAPAFNTAAIFATSAQSWHGHPEPLNCPPGRSRKSIALYYYSAAGNSGVAHSTIYR